MPKSDDIIILWALGLKCNLRCKYCYFGIPGNKTFNPKTPATTTDSAIKFIKKINKKIRFVCLAGGEPLLNKDIYKILKALKKRKIPVIISSNGILLTKQNSDKFINYGLDAIFISLDSCNKEDNDKLRGGFNSVVQGINNIVEAKKKQKSKIKIGVYSVITKQNLKELVKTLDFVIGQRVDYFVFQPIWLPENHSLQKELTLTKKQVASVKKLIKETRERSAKILIPSNKYLNLLEKNFFKRDARCQINNCFGGKGLFFIDPRGDVYDCPSSYKINSTPHPKNIKDRNFQFNSRQIGRCNLFSTDCLPMWELYYSKLLSK